MKKLISLVLMLALFSTMLPVAMADGFELSEFGNEMNLLHDLGIVTNRSNLERDIPRCEFATIVLRMTGLEETALQTAYSGRFPDVPSDHWAAKNIEFAVQAGFFSGGSDGLFRPDNGVTPAEALKVLVTVLGYDEVAKAKGGFPTGYMAVAADLELTSGLSLRTENIHRGELYTLVYRALHTDMLIREGYGGTESDYKSYENRNILTEYLKIYQHEGIVTADETEALEGENCEAGELEIDGEKYILKKQLVSLVGKKINAYYRESKSLKRTIVSYSELENEVITLSSASISEFDSERMRYVYLGESDTLEYRISDDSAIIYNHTPVTSHIADVLVPECGSVTLINTDGDNVFETVKIDEYYNIVANRYSSYDEIIADKSDLYSESDFERSLYIGDYDKITVRDTSGKIMEPADIISDDILTVYKDISGRNVEIVISKTQVNSKLVEIDFSAPEPVFTLESGQYRVSPDVRFDINHLSLGTSYIFGINAYGDIVTAVNADTSYQQGYLVDTAKGKGLDAKCMIRLVKPDSTLADFYFADNLSVTSTDGTEIKSKKMKAEDALALLSSNLGGERQLILYKSSPSGSEKEPDIVTAIILAYAPQTLEEAEAISEYQLLRLDYYINTWPGTDTAEKVGTSFRKGYWGIGQRVMFNSAAKVYYVPTLDNTDADMDLCYTGTIGDFADNQAFSVSASDRGINQTFDVYSIGGHKIQNDVMVYYGISTGDSLDSAAVSYMIADIRQVYDSENSEGNYQLTLISSRHGEFKYTLEDEEMLYSSYFGSKTYEGSTPTMPDGKEKLEVGDIIRAKVTTGTTQINELVLSYDKKTDTLVYTPTAAHTKGRVLRGKVIKTEGNSIKYTLANNGDTECTLISGVAPTIYNSRDNSVQSGSAADILEGDDVVIHFRYGYIIGIYIYK